MSLRDTLLQLGYVLIAGGAIFATWALLTGPLARFTRVGDDASSPDVTASTLSEPASTLSEEDDPKTGSTEAPS